MSIPNDAGWGICLRMLKPVKDVPLKISVITCFFFPVDPDDRVIMELQCSTIDYLLASV